MTKTTSWEATICFPVNSDRADQVLAAVAQDPKLLGREETAALDDNPLLEDLVTATESLLPASQQPDFMSGCLVTHRVARLASAPLLRRFPPLSLRGLDSLAHRVHTASVKLPLGKTCLAVCLAFWPDCKAEPDILERIIHPLPQPDNLGAYEAGAAMMIAGLRAAAWYARWPNRDLYKW